MEKGNSGRAFLLIRRLTRAILWGLLVFIALSAFKEMRGANATSKNVPNQVVLKGLK